MGGGGEREATSRLIFRYRSYLLYVNSQILMKGNNGLWARASVAGAPFTANQEAQINREHIKQALH